jgi:hypothetical protein
VVIGKLASEIKVTRFSDKVNRDKDGDYVLTGGGYPYEIDRERINTAPKLVGWIRHLSAKTWFKAKDAMELIDLVSHDYPKVIPSKAATYVRFCGNDDVV